MKARRRKTAKPKGGKASSAPRRRSTSTADVNETIALLTRERDEALEQRTAASEVLKVISRSTFDLQAVLETLVESAAKLCEADIGYLRHRDGDVYRLAATYGLLPEQRKLFAQYSTKPDRGSLFGRALIDGRTVHIPDVVADPDFGRPEAQRIIGFRAGLAVPLRRGSDTLGVLTVQRKRAEPFSKNQIALIETFADQAVIAIENTRLLNELRESLAQQTATSEVLQVISSSPGELQPVFETMLANATRICGAKFGTMVVREGDAFRHTAVHNAPPAFVEERERNPLIRPQPNSGLARVLATKQVYHIADMRTDPAYLQGAPSTVALVDAAGARSVAVVPLLKDGEVVGAIAIFRQEVLPFTDKQIALVQNFAAQAVIAIENTRLLNELRQRTDDLTESLEQQTATSEVLQVISSSPGELKPVFQAMLDNATRICGAGFGTLFRIENDEFEPVAHHNVPAVLTKHLAERGRIKPRPGSTMERVMRTKDVVHVVDLRQDPDAPGNPAVKYAGARTYLGVPMLKEGTLIGALVIYRLEVRPFTDKQIELVQNFAAQAVIAIENTRLLNELRQRTDDLSEALEQQTATSEVLSVISSSPGELAPVFQALLESATRICQANFGILMRYEDGMFHPTAMHNFPQALADHNRKQGPFRPAPGSRFTRVLQTKQVIHTADDAAEATPGIAARLGGARSIILVPMLKDDELIGTILIYRQEVRPFTDKQIALVQNFAAQAVIAIENVRLLNELRESLQQQTATSDVLKVISRSAFDLQTVLNTLVESAARLCDADYTFIFRLDGDSYRLAANHGFSPEYAEWMKKQSIAPGSRTLVGRTSAARQPVLIPDATVDPEYGWAESIRRGNFRTMLGIPLLREGAPIGVIAICRSHVQPFTDKQIELVSTFADQAVIAIENARLLNELRESLQQQTATADVLKVISRFAFDLQPVFDSMAESAVTLCEAERAYIFRFDGELLRAVASFNAGPENQDWVYRNPIPLGRHSISARAGLERRTVQVTDVQADPEYNYVGRDVDPIRTTLAVPMLKGDELIGTITIYRLEVKPFTEKQIALMETFADQAVIAIENVRLFDEIQDKSRQLAEASQHKSQFLANMSHELRTPLNAILGYTELIVDGVYGAPSDKMQDVLKRIESNGRHLLGLINDVLDLSKIEAGQLVLSLSDYSLKDVVQTVFGAIEPLATEKNIALKIDVAADLPPGRGDERRLTQVLLNLVGNAIKFTDIGEVVIAASAANGSYNLAVRDTGPGISAADQAKLFQEFQQADNSITRKKGGTGLGLAISRRIIELHGGRIGVDSQVGQGSTFWVTLPVMAENHARP